MNNGDSNRNDQPWPEGSGPLKSLEQLGLITRGTLPGWARNQRMWETDAGVLTYRSTTQFLSREAIRQLAALTFEGWLVYINPLDNEIKIKINRMKD